MSPRLARRLNPARVVAYVRVSTEEQANGPEAQRATLEAWCTREGKELVETFRDLGVSGGTELDKRPGLLAALDALGRLDAGVLLVAKRDRLARDVMLAAMFERLVGKAGATLLSADGSGNGAGPEAEMMRGIINVFAQYERALIRARTKAALAVKANRGERIGNVPWGKQLAEGGKLLETSQAELAALERIRGLRALGIPLRRIVDVLNAEGPQPRGQRWHLTTVADLLKGRREH